MFMYESEHPVILLDSAMEHILEVDVTFFFFFVLEFFRHYTAAQSSAAVLALVSFGGQEVTDALSKSLILKNDLVYIKAPVSL